MKDVPPQEGDFLMLARVGLIITIGFAILMRGMAELTKRNMLASHAFMLVFILTLGWLALLVGLSIVYLVACLVEAVRKEALHVGAYRGRRAIVIRNHLDDGDSC